MVSIEDRKARIEAEAKEKLAALEAEAQRRQHVAVLDEQMAVLRAERKALLDKLEVLHVQRGRLVPKRPRARAEDPVTP